MAIVDDITAALKAAANAGALAAGTAGKDLTQDVQNFVVPHLKDIAIQVASIIEKRAAGIYTDITTKALIESEEDAVQTLVETIVSLTVLEVQTIVNSILTSLYKSVNTALGFALLAV